MPIDDNGVTDNESQSQFNLFQSQDKDMKTKSLIDDIQQDADMSKSIVKGHNDISKSVLKYTAEQEKTVSSEEDNEAQIEYTAKNKKKATILSPSHYTKSTLRELNKEDQEEYEEEYEEIEEYKDDV